MIGTCEDAGAVSMTTGMLTATNWAVGSGAALARTARGEIETRVRCQSRQPNGALPHTVARRVI